jgi:hypothetical protein
MLKFLITYFLHSFYHSTTTLEPFVGPWPFLQFRNHFYTEPTIPAFERAKTLYVLGRATTVNGIYFLRELISYGPNVFQLIISPLLPVSCVLILRPRKMRQHVPPELRNLSELHGKFYLPPAFALVSFKVYSSTLKMEAKCS